MIRSLSMMDNAIEVCAKHRERMYGREATPTDYKDSYVINACIESFIGQPEELMREDITRLDRSQSKTSKSVNFRSDCYEKVSTFSKLLHIPESEVCRRILYYMLNAESGNTEENRELASLKSKVLLLQTQIEASMKTLKEILKETDLIGR